MRKIIIVLFVSMLLTACSTFIELTHQDKESLVRQNLEYLNAFQGSGILEVSFKGLSLKKEFLIKKNPSSLRLDILDSGIFALLPSPFASLYIKDRVLITNYGKGLFPDMIIDKLPLAEFLDLSSLPQGIIDEIVKNRKFSISIVEFNFDETYKLSSIKMNKENINLIYQGADLVKIKLDSEKADVQIEFDSFQKGLFDIKPIKIENNID